MPELPMPDDVAALLARPNPAVMATVASDGRPVTVATWYLVEDDGTILLNLDAGRARLQHLRTDSRVSLTALAEGNWYTHVSVQGRVSSIPTTRTCGTSIACPATTAAARTAPGTARGSASVSRPSAGTAGAPPPRAEGRGPETAVPQRPTTAAAPKPE